MSGNRPELPRDPRELEEGKTYLEHLPDGRSIPVKVLEVRDGNADGRGIITIMERV